MTLAGERRGTRRRRLRYSVAMSLDGFIADEDGGYDWITQDDGMDFDAYLAKIDTLLMGRGTWAIMDGPDGAPLLDGMKVFVVSTTLPEDVDPRVTVIGSDVVRRVAALKEEEGRDIWLFGGGVLFRSMLEAGLVDRVEVGIIPTLLGAGIPLLPGLDGIAGMTLHSHEVFPSGIVLVKYDVESGA